MNLLKSVLLGAAAVAATAITAQAEDLNALKAQIETLNARIAALETAPSVPDAYNPLSLPKAPQILAPGETLGANALAQATTMAILPTADAPDMPPAAQVQWSGHVEAAFVYERLRSGTFDTDSTHIVANTEINLKATNDTAVGEVGVHVRLEAEAEGHSMSGVDMSRAYGWWKMTPELSLKAGYKNSIGGVGHGNDMCSCYFNSYTGVVGGRDDSTQLELRYASGPIEAAIAIEHHDDYNDDVATGGAGDVTGEGQTYAVAGEVKWSGDTISGEISGFYGQIAADTLEIAGAPPTGDVDSLNDTALDIWQIGAGLTASLGMFSLSGAAGMGQIDGADYWEASLFASAELADSISAEVGVGYENMEDLFGGVNALGVAGGLYWSPVDKLIIGAEASWVELESTVGDGDHLVADIVTVFKF